MLRSSLIPILALLALSGQGASNDQNPQAAVDHIVVMKAARTMKLYSGATLVKEYKVALGTNPIGPKRQQGDHRTPEGAYIISGRNPHSQFHRSLRISYPNAADREWARLHKVNPGGDIMIHGLPPAYAYLGPLHRQYDWTWGCIAVTDQEIEEIWGLVKVGTKVEIRP